MWSRTWLRLAKFEVIRWGPKKIGWAVSSHRGAVFLSVLGEIYWFHFAFFGFAVSLERDFARYIWKKN